MKRNACFVGTPNFSKTIIESDINDMKPFLFFEKSTTIREYTVEIICRLTTSN